MFWAMGFVGGRVFWNPEMPGSNPAERAAVYDAMNATLARLHSFEPARIGLGDFGRGDNYVARQVDRWSKQYRASETETIDSMERLIEWLPAHIPPAGPPRLVHGDYRLDNMNSRPSESNGCNSASFSPSNSSGGTPSFPHRLTLNVGVTFTQRSAGMIST